MNIAENLAAVRARIDAATRSSGRAPDAVTLVVVTKGVPFESVRVVLGADAVDVGENRAQELLEKAEQLDGSAPAPRWHFIGQLQRNKVRMLAPRVALWQSVDRADLADELGRRAPGARVLLEVNVAGEAQKGGCAPSETSRLAEHCQVQGLVVEGLMTVPPAAGDPRPHFARLRALTDELALPVCSMGMSGDFEAAIGEGATMVRVGTAVFGPRPTAPDARR